LETQSADINGKVILRFRLHPDGRISDMTVLKNEVSDLLQMTCQRAILDPKFPKWPREMRLDLPNDFYDITFTFYYEP
jgi:outer membrane biosynthesis protein TonB